MGRYCADLTFLRPFFTFRATDQFGSGGGFSSMWNQSHASWQTAAVARYVAMGPSLPRWPPAGSFPPLGRATPDVSALGEGFQVYVQLRHH